MNRINWLYFLQDKTKQKKVIDVFLYGLSLPTKFTKNEKLETRSVKLNSKKEIVIYQNIGELKFIPKDKINFKEIYPYMQAPRESSIITKKTIIQVSSNINQPAYVPKSLLGSPILVAYNYPQFLRDRYISISSR